jgi:hypothetical protein
MPSGKYLRLAYVLLLECVLLLELVLLLECVLLVECPWQVPKTAESIIPPAKGGTR